MPGRSGTVYKNWLAERGEDLRAGVRIAHASPSRDSSENTIALASSTDTTSVPGACHIVTLAGDAPGEVTGRAGQDTTGHRGRKG